MRKQLFRLIGVAGTVAFIAAFATHPNWPTPDKILVFLMFVFMIFGRAKELLKRFLPFVILLIAYESFRGLVPGLNSRVEYSWMINTDRLLFGGTLPTTTLQHWLWHGHVQWYDVVFYITYMLHFVLPFGLALLIWKYRDKFYWQYITSFVVLSFVGFATYLAVPAAPPWLAADKGYIPPIVQVSGRVWDIMGLKAFPTVYSRISPNPVAALPSLHAAYATMVFIFIYKLFGKKKALLASLHPLIIYVGTVYAGEHYAIDEIVGIVYAFAAYFAVDWLYARYKLHHKLFRYWQVQLGQWVFGPEPFPFTENLQNEEV